MALASQKTGAVRRIAALEIGYIAVHAVEVETRGSEVTILKRGMSPLPEDTLDNLPSSQAVLSQAMRAALSQAGITSKQVVAALPRRVVTVKTARLPHAPPEAIAGMVAFEAQQYIPFQIEDVVLDHQVVSDDSDDMSSVMIVAARRSLVEHILAACDSAGIEVIQLTVSSFGLAEHARSAIAPQALVEIDRREMDMAVVGDGRLLFSRSATLPEPEAGAGLSPAFGGEVARSIAAYDNEYRGHPVTRLLIGGSAAAEAVKDPSLQDLLDVPLDRLNGRLLPAADPEAISYATAVGVALTHDPGAVCRINLVPASRTEKKEAARRRVQGMIAVAVIALALFFAFDAFSASISNRAKERQEAQRMNDRLSKARKVHDRVKKEHDEVVGTYRTVSQGLARDLPALAAIKAVSDSIPRDAGIYLSQLSFERNGTVAIHGNAKSELAVTQLVTALQGAGLFASVRLGYMGETQTSELAPAAASPAAVPGGAPAATPGTAPAAAPAPERIVTSTTSFIITGKLPDNRPVEEKRPGARSVRRRAEEEKP